VLPSTKTRQAFDALVFVQPMRDTDGVVVQQQDLSDFTTAHPIIQQHQRVGTPGQSMSQAPIATQVDQVATRCGVKEAGTDRATIAAELIRKGLFGFPRVGV
jgi:hypothetical protein